MIKNKSLLLGCLGLMVVLCSTSAINIQNLRCEYLADPVGLDAAQPRLSWVLDSDQRGEGQTAYQILVASSRELLDADKGDVWDTGKVKSDETVQIIYQGTPLAARERSYWKVRVWDYQKHPSAWSPVAQWEMGLLQKSDWIADWIAPAPSTGTSNVLEICGATCETVSGAGLADMADPLRAHISQGRLSVKVDTNFLGKGSLPHVPRLLRVDYKFNGEPFTIIVNENQTLALPESEAPLPCLRKTFVVKAPIKHAVLYATALGLYEAHLNGRRIGDHLLAPDWTDYRRRVRYQAYDVSALLKPGDNAIAALLANGWFCGHIGNGGFEYFGKQPAFLAQLEVTYEDGSRDTIATDATWKWHDSPIMSADFMLGEKYDAGKEITGWDQPGGDDRAWLPVQTRDESARKLEAQVMEPVRELCELKPQSVKEAAPGHWIYDLGQNMVGVVRMKVAAAAGTKVTLRHAEMLNPDGTIYTANLRGAPSMDEYICNGDGVETWQPRFTYHGFRYVEITGLTNAPGLAAVTGIVFGSDTRRTGQFTCSDPRLNQLQSNIQWGQRGNYLSVPTDCPQRDERLGWMGDAAVFIRTATYNADVAAFFSKWLVDVDDGQADDGAYGNVSPNTMRSKGAPAWADAGLICPWTIYEAYGDKRILEAHLPAMTRWVECMRTNSTNLIRDGDRSRDYGDWLAINAKTSKELIATAYFAYSAHLLAESYYVAGDTASAKKYQRLFENIKTAFNKHYVAPDGRIKGGTQCAYAMALKFELLPTALRAKAAQYLVEDIKSKSNHLSTGFVGVSFLLPVLTQTGHPEVAYQLLMQDTFPSWLFSVRHGATTIWERWDGWTPEKGFQSPGMNSFNHYSLGSCGEYLFGGIGGIRPESPGYKKIRIEPVIGSGLTWARTDFDSIHGRIATSWKRAGDQFTLAVIIPPNTTAAVCIPTPIKEGITEGDGPLNKSQGVREIKRLGAATEVQVASGAYQFGWKMPPVTK